MKSNGIKQPPTVNFNTWPNQEFMIYFHDPPQLCHSGSIIILFDQYIRANESQVMSKSQIDDNVIWTRNEGYYKDIWIISINLKKESMYSNSIWVLVDKPDEIWQLFQDSILEDTIYMVQQ